MDDWNWNIQKRYVEVKLSHKRYKGQLEDYVNECDHDENNVIAKKNL